MSRTVRADEKYVIDIESGCWLWQGTLNRDGYGRTWADKREHMAHRWMYEQHVGRIPAGKTLDHLCRVRSCVNPDHLEPVTAVENVKRGGNSLKTHCPKGHEYTEGNTYRSKDGRRRHCRTCMYHYAQDRAAKKPPPKPRKKGRRTAQIDKNKADRLFSLIVRSRGACQRCEKTTNLQCAHVISRRYSNTRCVLTNAFCLCAGCHIWGHSNPVEWASFVLGEIGQSEYQRLYQLSQLTSKVDWHVVAAELAVTAKNLGVAA